MLQREYILLSVHTHTHTHIHTKKNSKMCVCIYINICKYYKKTFCKIEAKLSTVLICLIKIM